MTEIKCLLGCSGSLLGGGGGLGGGGALGLEARLDVVPVAVDCHVQSEREQGHPEVFLRLELLLQGLIAQVAPTHGLRVRVHRGL